MPAIATKSLHRGNRRFGPKGDMVRMVCLARPGADIVKEVGVRDSTSHVHMPAGDGVKSC
jgi:hypothetical protein